MISITAVRTFSLSIYNRSRTTYARVLQEKFGVDVVGHMRKSGNYPNFWTVSTIGAAGATAGSLITVLACEYHALAAATSEKLDGDLANEEHHI